MIFTKTSSMCHCQFEYDRIRLTRFRRISAANIGPNLFRQNRTVSWLISMPRSCRRSSTLRSESGKRTYSITAKRMISGLVLKYLNGECFVIRRRYETARPVSSSFCLTVPVDIIAGLDEVSTLGPNQISERISPDRTSGCPNFGSF